MECNVGWHRSTNIPYIQADHLLHCPSLQLWQNLEVWFPRTNILSHRVNSVVKDKERPYPDRHHNTLGLVSDGLPLLDVTKVLGKQAHDPYAGNEFENQRGD